MEFLNAYFSEEINGDVAHRGKKLNSMTPERKRELWTANNKRNNDSFGVTKSRNLLIYMDSFENLLEEDQYTSTNSVEDAMINYLDKKAEEEE